MWSSGDENCNSAPAALPSRKFHKPHKNTLAQTLPGHNSHPLAVGHQSQEPFIGLRDADIRHPHGKNLACKNIGNLASIVSCLRLYSFYFQLWLLVTWLKAVGTWKKFLRSMPFHQKQTYIAFFTTFRKFPQVRGISWQLNLPSMLIVSFSTQEDCICGFGWLNFSDFSTWTCWGKDWPFSASMVWIPCD